MQKMMTILYDVGLLTIMSILKKYVDSELEEAATIRNFRIVKRKGFVRLHAIPSTIIFR